jgi:phosphatidylinositol alpha-1,6-mannosyltransferase
VATHYWSPHRGGIETVAREQCERLVQRGHEVRVITSRLRGDPPELRDGAIDVRRVRVWNPLERRGIPYPVFSPGLVAQAWEALRWADVALVHGHTFLASAVVARLARPLGVPVVALQHNTFIAYGPPWENVQRAADALLGAPTLARAERLLAVSEETRAYVTAMLPGAAVEVLHNGVDPDRFHPAGAAERAAVREELGLSTSAFVVLTVRRMVRKNGIDTLLEAAEHLPTDGSVTFALCGGGPDLAGLQATCRDRGWQHVRMPGFVTDDALPRWYRAADVFVLPSRSGEGFPMAVLEALASGVPVIATRAGGQTDVVRPGTNGWLVPPSDPGAMAAALREAAAMDLGALGRSARASAAALAWSRQVDRLEAVLAEVARA